MNILPSCSGSNSYYSRFIDIGNRGDSSKRNPAGYGNANCSDPSWGKFFCSPNTKAGIPCVGNVTLQRNPLKVICSVVLLVAIDVIDVVSVLISINKSCRDKPMNVCWPALFPEKRDGNPKVPVSTFILRVFTAFICSLIGASPPVKRRYNPVARSNSTISGRFSVFVARHRIPFIHNPTIAHMWSHWTTRRPRSGNRVFRP